MLTGDLSDFSLREVVQFLGAAGKSGLLRLRHGTSDSGILIRDGAVCVALADADAAAGLAARTVRAGLADVDLLHKVAEDHRGAGGFAIAGALGRAIEDHAAVLEVYAEHTRETVGWLGGHADAAFVFERSPHVHDWPFDPFEQDALFADVDRRSAEWTALRKTFGDLSGVVGFVPEPATSAQFDVAKDLWSVIALIDGSRTVRHIVELSGEGHLETCRQLRVLIDAGLVELSSSNEGTALGALQRSLDALRSTASGWMHSSEPAGQHGLRVGVPRVLDDPPASADVPDPDADLDAVPVPAEAADITSDVPRDAEAPDANRGLLRRLIGDEGGDGQ